MPKKDFPLLIQFFKSFIKSVFMRLFIAGSNAPTPGSIIALQRLESLKFLINIISSPRLSRDFVTEWILPIP